MYKMRLLRRPDFPVLRLLLLTFLALLIHGYHLGTDDSEIYIPAIKKAADPALYPFGSEFFMTHAHLSMFSNIVGSSARLTHLPYDAVIFAWHLAGIFLLLAATWHLLGACFENRHARWSGVALVAALLCVPVTDTALFIMDPYLTARTLSTPATLFAIACFVRKEYKSSVAWLAITALLHPQMSVFLAAFLGSVLLARRVRARPVPAVALGLLPITQLPFVYDFQPASGPAREALFSRNYFFVSTWTWYEWIGVFAPLALLWWFSSVNPRTTTPVFRLVSRTLVPFGLLFTAFGIMLSSSPHLQNYARLQPMRAFHLVYVIFFALLGGLIGEYVLRHRAWRWAALFVPLAASMSLVERATYPSSRHIEWPGVTERNPWVSAFLWIRANTPKNAVFALDPDYMLLPARISTASAPSPSAACWRTASKTVASFRFFRDWPVNGRTRCGRKPAGAGSALPISATWPSAIQSPGFSNRTGVCPTSTAPTAREDWPFAGSAPPLLRLSNSPARSRSSRGWLHPRIPCGTEVPRVLKPARNAPRVPRRRPVPP